jgi:hypothetical protein
MKYNKAVEKTTEIIDWILRIYELFELIKYLVEIFTK